MEVTWYDPSVLDIEDLYPERPRRITRAEFETIASSGVFDDEHVELLYGQIVEMAVQSAEHAELTGRVHEWLVKQLGPTYRVFAHTNMGFWDHSMPEPDITVTTKGRLSEAPATAFLLVEVAESSLRKDLQIKAPLYAEAGISTYWLIDRPHGIVHVMTRPVDRVYTRIERVGAGGILTCEGLPGVAISVDELFAD